MPTKQMHSIGFIFTGQGAQYPGMGQALYEHLPCFQSMLMECSTILDPLLEYPLIDILYNIGVPSRKHPIHQTALTQPALFTIETSLARTLFRWGIQPSAVMGHSLGELAAAYTSGVFNLEDGLHIVTQRGALMQAMPKNGVMSAIETDAETVLSVMKTLGSFPAVGIAAYNGPRNVVISGDSDGVESITNALMGLGVRTTSLRVSHAFHSELMLPMVEPFMACINCGKLHAPRIPLVSTVTGNLVHEEITQAEHWGRGVRQPVCFEQALLTMSHLGINIFVEIGPHPVLIGMGKQCLPDDGSIIWLPLLHKRQNNWTTLLGTLGQLSDLGIEVNWNAFNADFKQSQYNI
ncbi:MAG: acyltransferase domain-containing protein [Anaerolineae bacterium]|nr:acyltransferase domain-containing protein [Anaerolineae bacterium]